MYTYRPITAADRQTILAFHCEIIYASDTPWARKVPYDHYKQQWFSTAQPNQFFSHLLETCQDARTIAEIVEDDQGKPIGYIWVVFNDIDGYNLTVAEIMDVFVIPEQRRTGLGTRLLKYIEEKAKSRGAHVLRSETGIVNKASIELHKRHGFQTYRVLLEKPLTNE